ncbi:MAG: TrkH family potassium uptake protein [Clostridia bacterium]|nr:TrkH family potassium uptake protein [Clostridia bacterium]
MVGWVLVALAALLLLPLVCAICYGESILPYLYTILISGALGGLAVFLIRPRKKALYAREGYLTVALTWIVVSLVGCLPFLFSGAIPRFADAFFETVSGFTTTGSTVLSNVEILPKGILFWRSFTHWIGGMGVIVFIMAILPSAGSGSVHIMKAEVPGTSFGKVAPKLKVTAKWLYYIYIALTVIMVGFLLSGGMPLFDSLVHAFGTAGTGGFSIYNTGIGHYGNLYFEIVITVFMLLFGVNFNVFFLLLLRDFKSVLKSDELWTYFGIVAGSSLLIAGNIVSLYNNFAEALRYSSFQVASVVTTTGYATADYCTWPIFSQVILVLLTFCGACGGSTGGGFKITRILLIFKKLHRDLHRMVHPRSVKAIRLNGKQVDEATLNDLSAYTMAYFALAAVGLLLISLDTADFSTSFTAMATCLNNVGPGIGAIGPTGNFGFFSDFSKYVLSALMLFGRLEIFPLLLTFCPVLYRNK